MSENNTRYVWGKFHEPLLQGMSEGKISSPSDVYDLLYSLFTEQTIDPVHGQVPSEIEYAVEFFLNDVDCFSLYQSLKVQSIKLSIENK